jgi:hypothetical protein
MTIPRTAILLAAVTALALPLRALAACPDSHGQLIGYNNLFPVSTASFDTTYNVPGGPSGDVGFDLAAGTLHMSRTVYYQANWTRVIATDAFDVMGVAPGTPVTLVANLDVTGQLVSPGCGGSGCGGWFQASITQGSLMDSLQATFANVFTGGQVDVIRTLSLPLTIVAGTPATIAFEIAVFVPAGGDAGGSGSGIIHFTALPSGASVVSCRGFGAGVTPTRSSTWGQLKLRYH